MHRELPGISELSSSRTISILFILSMFGIILALSTLRPKDRPIFYPKYPKLIWTYWHDDNIPPIIRRCIDTWKMHNPDYTMTILNNRKLKELCGVDLSMLNIDPNFKERQSDFARLFVMAKYGGFWIDSSIICTKPLAWVQEIQEDEQAEIFGYYASVTTNKEHPVVENWFFAAIPRSKFVRDWLNEALFMTTFPKEEDYVKFIETQVGLDMQNLKPSLPYLVMHLCTLVIQNRDETYKTHFMDSLEGPFKYLHANDWKLPESFSSLCKDNSMQTALVKLRGKERAFIEEHNDQIQCRTTQNASIKHVFASRV